jgi:hypothetical protein
MKKSTITKTWLAGLAVLVAGLIVGGISLGLLLTKGGYWVQVPGTTSWNFHARTDSYFWTTLTWVIVGFSVAAIGGIVQIVAWIGAVANTAGLQDRTWFTILLVGGLVGLVSGFVGLAAMVAYLIAGPDGTALRQPASLYPAVPPYPPYPPYQPYPTSTPPTASPSSSPRSEAPLSQPKTLVPMS